MLIVVIYIKLVTIKSILKQKKKWMIHRLLDNNHIYPYIMNENNDIDSYDDLEKSKKNIKLN